LPTTSSRSLRLASFDEDPYVEFEVGSALAEWRADEWLEVAIRVEYEVVVSESALLRLLDRYALQVTGMRQLSAERMDVQNLARELRQQHADMQGLAGTVRDLAGTVQALAGAMAHAVDLQRLTEQFSNLSQEVQQLQRGIDQLARRGLWPWIRRVIRRGK